MRPNRILYAAGPGDVAGTFEHWLAKDEDVSEVASTYSGQFFDVCRRWGASALVVATNARPAHVEAHGITVVHRPTPGETGGALRYHLGQLVKAARLIRDGWRIRADAAVIADADHWFLLAPLALSGVKIIPSLHCSLWPVGHRRRDLIGRTFAALNALFWRRCVAATIAVSPECERQVRELAGDRAGPIFQSRATYDPTLYRAIQPASHPGRDPFRVLYAGRIEPSKGVFDLVAIAAELERQRPGRFRWDLCGDGSAMDALRQRIAEAGLESIMTTHGRLDRDAMLQRFEAAHAVIVPTTSRFPEGLNKVAVEGVLAGRPVVTSRMSNALDVVGEGIVEAQQDDIGSYAHALLQLADDPALFERKRSACSALAAPFFDPQHGWGAALERALRAAGFQPLTEEAPATGRAAAMHDSHAGTSPS